MAIDYKTGAAPRGTTEDGIPVFCAYDALVPIAETKPNPMNPNKHTPKQIELLGDIIAATGWRAAITVSKRSGLITKGHGRLAAAQKRGWKSVPVEYQDYASDEEEHADLIADNRIAELASMDTIKLANMLQDMDTGAVPMELTAYGEQEIANIIAAIEGADDTVDDGADKAAEPTAHPFSKRGDLWHLGRHRLLCGDATSESDMTRLMDGKLGRMVHTDPPYGVSFLGTFRKGATFDMIKNDDLAGDELVRKLLAPTFRNYVKFTQDDAAFYIWHSDACHREFEDAMIAAGLDERQIIIWVKNNMAIGHNDYQFAHEPCIYAGKVGNKPAFFGGKGEWTTWKVTMRDVTDMSTTLAGGITLTDGKGHRLFATDKPPKGKKSRHIRMNDGRSVYLTSELAQSTIWEIALAHKAIHPNQKPVEIPARAIENSSEPGDIVLDFFAGSGSTLIAADDLDRLCFCAELDPKYVDAIVRRFHEHNTDAQVTLERDGREILLQDVLDDWNAEREKAVSEKEV